MSHFHFIANDRKHLVQDGVTCRAETHAINTWHDKKLNESDMTTLSLSTGSSTRNAVDCIGLPSGGWLLRSQQPLEPYARCLGDMLEHWAASEPQRVFIAQRVGGDGEWCTITYSQTLNKVRAIGQALLDLGMNSASRPLTTLARNSIEHALVLLGAMHVGIPVCPLAPAYASPSGHCAKLQGIFDFLEPEAVYIGAGVSKEVVKSLAPGNARIICEEGRENLAGSLLLDDLIRTPPREACDTAFRAITPDTVAKVLMTSGSTGDPKGVINTQRMMCSNQQSFAQVFPFYAKHPPVQLSWLPWHHTAGGNHTFNLTLRHGGTLYIDDGRPLPGEIEKTIANLREISPTSYAAVPAGLMLLLPYLEKDEELRQSFFRRLEFLSFAGASMPPETWGRLKALAETTVDRQLLYGTNWGMTETAPTVTVMNFETNVAGNIGLPIPGCEVKLVPDGEKFEMRVRGPNVTPGYWGRPDLTRAAFDSDGFFLTGDAGRLIDESQPSSGIQFDGRINEDFKLQSGTWVRVGALRERLVAQMAPLVWDVVIAGQDRAEIGLLIFLDEQACRRKWPDINHEISLDVMAQDDRIYSCLLNILQKFAAAATGGSLRPARALILTSPPAVEVGEITDKGYINQRAVLRNRAHEVELLYEKSPSARVLHCVPPIGLI